MPHKLNPTQLDVLSVLDWLMDRSTDARGTGRTYVTAIACIRAACRNPSQWISVHDYQTADLRAHRHLFGVIMGLIHEDTNTYHGHPLARWVREEGHGHMFVLDLPAPVEDWLPVGAVDISMIRLPPSGPPPSPTAWEHLLDEGAI
jgi:hypothetical protein